MATNRIHVSLFDLVTSLSDVTDLVNPALNDHHKKSAYIAYRLAQDMSQEMNMLRTKVQTDLTSEYAYMNHHLNSIYTGSQLQ